MLKNFDNCIQDAPTPLAGWQCNSFVRAADRFLYSPWYFFLIGAMTVIANAFAAEIPVYVCFILIALYLSFFGRDYLPLMPIFICCYIAPASANNPGRNEGSIFYGSSGTFLLILAGIFVISLILRLARDSRIGRKAFFTAERRLLPGILALGAAYLLSGAGSGHYFDHGWGNLLFSAIQFLSVFLLYYLYTGAVRWDKAPAEYMAWTGMCIGFVLLVEIALIYLRNPILEDGRIQRYLIYTGWGNYNNVGALLTMMIPFAFQLASVKRHSWLYFLSGTLFLIGVVLTCSRTSLLFAAAIYLMSFLLACFKSRNRRSGVIAIAAVFVAALLVVAIFHKQFFSFLSNLFANHMSIQARVDGYKKGLEQFLKHPLFGGTFYPTDYNLFEWSQVDAFTSFFPPRWHNTLIQLAASCGIVGLAAYGYHRWQTIRLIWKNPSLSNLFIALSIGALLLTSLTDCHFFNVGPTMFYSLALSFAEKRGSRANAPETPGKPDPQ